MKPLVLVIEDDEKMRELVGDILGAYGIHVLPAESTEEGIDMARLQPPSAVLCDVMLPDGLGFDIIRALQKDSATKDIPVVFMTGNPSMMEHADKGSRKILLKPIPMEDMVKAVQDAIESGPERN
jgi:CheY-like chemotaxis protein